jgi:hypothetical protein
MAGGWLPLERPDSLGAQQRTLSERLLRVLGKDPQRLVPIRFAEAPVPPHSPAPESAATAGVVPAPAGESTGGS